MAASSFIDSIGVGAHIDSGAPVWMDTQKVAAELAFLGVRHVRDGTPYDWALPEYVALAKAGIRFNLLQVNPIAAPMTKVGAAEDVQRAHALEAAVPGSVESLEGANEYNISCYDLDGVNSYGNLAWGLMDEDNLAAAAAADPLLAKAIVVAASTASVSERPAASAKVGASNWHVYGGVGQQLGAGMTAGIAAARRSAPGKPVFITEAGISSSGFGSSAWGVADEATQAVIDTNALLDGFKNGAARTFIYDLMDDTGNSPQENHFGLFRADGTPKPAAVEISNLITLLSDAGQAASKPLERLGYSISGLPTTASSMLLQKLDGTFDLVVWNGGVSVYDDVRAVAPPTSLVTVSFGGARRDVSVFNPALGLGALQSAAGAQSVAFGLSQDPVIIQVAPASGSLVLHLSEDAYDGDAQISVTVDGRQAGGVYTVTALHGQGSPQAIALPGSFGAGPHAVSVSFLNDAYGGPGLDRNLYVESIDLDGVVSASGSAAIYTAGMTSFNVAQPILAPGSNVLSLLVSEDAYQGDAQFVVRVDGAEIGGVQTVTARHGQGEAQVIAVPGMFGAGPHDVSLSFINDAYGGRPDLDRNLYVQSVAIDGNENRSGGIAMYCNGTAEFNVPGAPEPPGHVVLQLSEDAWGGDAAFVASIDGKPLGAAQYVSASHALGQTQAFSFGGDFGPGPHDLAVSFINDAWGGGSLDRNLYVDAAAYDGVQLGGAPVALFSNGAMHFQVGADLS